MVESLRLRLVTERARRRNLRLLRVLLFKKTHSPSDGLRHRVERVTSRTRVIAAIVRRADIVIAAVGKANFVEGNWIKEGAIVIDAGYNAGNVGDVDFDAVWPRASLVTPVPGGVGPMTIATLIDHTADAALRQHGL